jgi:hypothetical protein
MNTLTRRIRRLETRYRETPYSDPEGTAVMEMLAAGEWRLALQFLERPDMRIIRQWQSARLRHVSLGRKIRTDFKDLTAMRRTLVSGLADAPAETKYRIARLLMAGGNGLGTAAQRH